MIPRGNYWNGGMLKLSERSLDHCGMFIFLTFTFCLVFYFFLGLLTLHESKAIIHLIVDKDNSKTVIKIKLLGLRYSSVGRELM